MLNKIKEKIKERDEFIEDFIDELEQRLKLFQANIYLAIRDKLYEEEEIEDAITAISKTIDDDKELVAFLAWYRKKVKELAVTSVNFFSLFGIERDPLIEEPVAQYMTAYTADKKKFKSEIKTLAAALIFAGMNVTDVNNSLKQTLIGGKKQGLAMRRLFVDMRDTAISSLRATDVRYARENQLEYAFYEGGLIETSRCFCEQRYDRFWSLDTINSWNSQSWTGKIEGIDVKVALGGYNCRHQLMWVDKETADKYGYDGDYGDCGG